MPGRRLAAVLAVTALLLGAQGATHLASAPACPVLEVVATSTRMRVGDMEFLEARVRPCAGAPAPREGVAWRSSDAKVATIYAGVVQALAPGRATIVATVAGRSATLEITVAPTHMAVLDAGVAAQPGAPSGASRITRR